MRSFTGATLDLRIPSITNLMALIHVVYAHKYKPKCTFSDTTIVDRTTKETWKDLKVKAMKPDYQNQDWFVSLFPRFSKPMLLNNIDKEKPLSKRAKDS